MNVTTPDLVAFATLNRTVSHVRAELSRAASEAVSGEKRDLSASLGARAGELALVNKALGDIEAGASRLSLTANRLRQTGAALAAARGTVDGLGERALTDMVLGGGVGATETAQSARAALDQVISTLNTRHAGRSLLAGDAVEGAALADADAVMQAARAAVSGAADEVAASAALDAFFAVGGDYDTVVYLGGAGEASAADLGDGSSVRFGAKADDQGVRATLEGLVRLALVNEVAGADTAWAETAASRLETGTRGLVTLETRNGLAANRVEARQAGTAAERLVLSATREALAGRDAYEAASEVQRLELQLEAAYTMTARLGRLSFSDYMR